MARLSDIPLARQITLIVLGTSALALALALASAAAYEVAHDRRALVGDLRSQAQIVGENCAAALAFDDYKTAQEVLAALRARPEIVQACLYEKDGTICAEYDSRRAFTPSAPRSPENNGYRFEGDYLLLFQKIKGGNDFEGTVFLRADLREQRVWLLGCAVTAIALALIFLTLAMFLTKKLQRLVADPILDLAKVVRDVTERGDYSLRVAEGDNAELGVLRKGFNEMVAQIQRRDQELSNAAELFRQLTDSIHEVFWITSPDKSELIYISPSYERIWGRARATHYASPKSWMEAIHPEDRERVAKAASEKQITGEYKEVYRIVRPDGAIRWIEDQAFPVRDVSGTIYRIVGIAEDITERKSTEARMAMLAHAVESTSELICITDLQDRFIFVNRAFQEVHGYSEAEILGKTPEILHSPRNPPSLTKEVLEQTRLGGWRGEVVDLRKDGTEFPVRLSTSLVKNEWGCVIGFMGVAQDITERKEFVDALQRQQAEMKVLFNLIPAMIWFKDAKNRILRLNKQAAEIVGKSVEEVEGKSTDEIHPQEASKFYSDDLAVIRSGLPKLGIVETIRDSEGKEHWIQTDKVPFCDEAGNVIGVVVVAHDITERKHAEESLRLLGSAVEQSKESIVITDAQLDLPGPRILFVNPAFTMMTGYAADEVLGKTPRILQGPRSDRVVLRKLRKALSSGESFRGEIINYRKNGTEFYLEWQVTPIRNASGTTTHFVAVQRDVTERKLAEARIATLAHAVESTSEMICITDLQDRFIFVNRAFQQAYGYDESEILGNTPDILFSPSNPPKLVEEVLQQTRSGGWHGEVLDRRKNGAEFPISLSTSQIRDGSGNVIGLMGVARDITERRKAQEAVRESEERFRTAFGDAPVAMVLVDLSGRFLLANEAFCKMMGYSKKEVVAKTILEITYPDDIDQTARYIENLLSGSQTSRLLDKRYIHKYGHVVWGRTTASLVRSESGQPLHFIAHIQDFTELRRLEREILEISDREQARIGQDLHDGLCQQLVSISFAINLLAERLATHDLAEAKAARTIAEFVDDGVTQARGLARGLFPVKLEAEGLASALQELATTVTDRFGVTCVLENPEVVLVADNATATHLYRIAQEAVANALKHSKAKQIVIKLTGDRDGISMEVLDDGIGFPDGITSGMGLHIMQYRARMIGGTLKIGPSPSGGTAVVCSLEQNNANDVSEQGHGIC